MTKWIEGIHYERLESGSLRCLKCERELKGPSALGPHLSVCFKKEVKEPTAPTPLQPSETGVTMQDQLRQYLSEVGFKKADAVITLVERYGYNVLGIYAALKDCNASLSTIRYVVKAWSAYNGEAVPDWMLKELNASPIPGGLQYYMPPQAEGEALKKEDLDKWWAEKQKEQEIAQLRAEVQQLRETLMRGEIANPNPQKSEVQALREEIAKMREDQVLKRLENLERYVHGPISNVYGLLGLTVKEAAEIIKTSPLRQYISTGQTYPYQPKQLEAGASEGIFGRLDKKYISEE